MSTIALTVSLTATPDSVSSYTSRYVPSTLGARNEEMNVPLAPGRSVPSGLEPCTTV